MRYAENKPPLSTETSHGIDPDYRCISPAVWWWWRILWSQPRVLVIERVLLSMSRDAEVAASETNLVLNIAILCSVG